MTVNTSENKEILQKNGFYDPMAVTWTEKYSSQIEAGWKKLPGFVAKFLVTFAIMLLCLALKGDWITIVVHMSKQFGIGDDIIAPLNKTSNFSWSQLSLETFKLQNFFLFWIGSMTVSYSIYFGIGGFLHWYFYVRQRDKAEDWKCQPHKWLSPELERHEIIVGSLTLIVNSTLSAVIACYISNGGYSTVYYNIYDYPLWWLFLQIPIVFIYQDYATYWLHRMYHIPWLYKHFHKLHHKYKQPTAFSVTAIHPIESVHIQLTVMIPMFVIPVHWFPFYGLIIYAYYHGITDHSGINFKSYWWQPWQPDTIFHDNHHQYFHVNFGFNMEIWDKIHGTIRRKDRIYREDVFYGQGKSISEATPEELKEEMMERLSENPLAYRENKLMYDLSDSELKDVAGPGKDNKKIN